MRRFSYFALFAALLLAGCELTGSNDESTDDPTDDPRTPVIQETVVEATFLREAVGQGLRGTEIHLNNRGERGEERPDSWQRSNDAFIRFGPTLGGGEFRFTIEEARNRVGPFRLLYYVNDLNALSDSLTTAVEEDSAAVLLTVTIPLEEEGPEFKGFCLSSFLGGLRPCLGGADFSAPDVELENGRIALSLRPVVVGTDLGFEIARVAFEGDVQAGGICNFGLGGTSFDVCDAILDYQSDLRGAFDALALDALSTPDVQAQIASGLRPFLDALGIGEVLAVRGQGLDLVIVHRK